MEKFSLHGIFRQEIINYLFRELWNLFFDAHLDLSMNAIEWNRDYRLKTNSIRKLEKGMNDLPGRELSTVSFPDLRNGNIGSVSYTHLTLPTNREV